MYDFDSAIAEKLKEQLNLNHMSIISRSEFVGQTA
jgi:hypothetical protein